MITLIKKSAIIFALISFTLNVFAQSNVGMTYQSVVRTSTNALVANLPIGVKISVLKTSATGPVVFSETHTPTTNANGLATFVIGQGTLVSGDLLSIDWGSDSYFLKTETDPTGGTSYSIANTSQFFYVPYAFYAEKSANGWDKAGNVAGSGEFLGTTNDEDLVFKRNNVENMRLTNTGISMNKEIKPNGTAGMIGQTLTSNGDGTMAWKNGAYNNNTRFKIRFREFGSSGVLDVLSIPYNLNTTNVSVGVNTFTINKTGLYHFDYSLNITAATATNPANYPDYVVYFGEGTTESLSAGPFVPMNSSNSSWKASGSGSFELYIVAPKIFRMVHSAYYTTSQTFNLYLNGHLISE